MYSDLISGLRLPAYDAFIVLTGTLEDPEKIAYFIRSYNTVDGEKDITLNTFNDFVTNGFTHLATLHIDKTAETTVLVFVNPNKDGPFLNLHRATDVYPTHD